MKNNVRFLCRCVLAGAVVMALATAAYAGTTTYKYDTLGRLIEVDYPDGSIITYTYDKAGNRTATVRQAGT